MLLKVQSSKIESAFKGFFDSYSPEIFDLICQFCDMICMYLIFFAIMKHTYVWYLNFPNEIFNYDFPQ